MLYSRGVSTMKIQDECIPCLIKRVIFETTQSTKNKEIREKALKNALKTISELYSSDLCSAKIATRVHKKVYETLGDNDPYKHLKKQSNEVAKKLLPRVKKLVKNSDDRLRTSMICSIVGNLLDFGITGGSKTPAELEHTFEKFYEEGLGHDDTSKLKKLLKKSKKTLFFTDNCGEIVFDKILCEEIKKFNPETRLTLVVKGTNVLSDATLKDALELGFNETVDNILTTGCFAVGLDLENLPDDLSEELNNSDLIISKGMANYEVFSESNYRPIAYLLRTKCKPIARSMKTPVDINVIKIFE